MMIDFDNFFRPHRMPRVPSRLVRYGIIYGGSAKDTLEEVDPNEMLSRYEAKLPNAQLRQLSRETNDMLKAGAKQLAARIATFIELLEEYEQATIDGPTESDDVKANKKAKRSKSAKKAG